MSTGQENLDQGAQEMTADELISGLDTAQQPAANEPQHPEGFDIDAWNQDFTRITGLKSIDEINNLRSASERVTTLERENADLKVKVNTNPWANDFSKRINDMIAGGKTDQLIPFIKLQGTNFGELSPEAVIKMEKSLQRPGWSQQKIDAWFNKEYPLPDEEAENFEHLKSVRDIEIEDKAAASIEALEKQKVDTSVVDNPKDQSNQQQQVLSERVEKLTPLTVALVDRITELPIQYDFEVNEDGSGGGSYELKYKPNLSSEKKQEIIQKAVQFHAGQGTPMTPAGLVKIQETVNTLITVATMQDRERAIIMDLTASAREQVVKDVTNTKPVAKGGNHAKPPSKKTNKEYVENSRGNKFY